MKCFYHNADFDGRCSAAIVKRAKPDIELIGIDYGYEFRMNELDEDEEIVMVDFSLQPFTEMIKLNKLVNLTWIDHHETALYDSKRSNVVFEGFQRNGIGACVLCWEYFFPEISVPETVMMLGKYDVWNHDDENVLWFQYGLKVKNLSFKDGIWPELLDDDEFLKKDVISCGKIVKMYIEKDNFIAAKTLCFETKLGDYRLLAANKSHVNSKFFDGIWDPNQHDVMCLFSWRPHTGLWKFTLYTTKEDINVGEIAKTLGGGGHRLAAGFDAKEIPFKITDVVCED